MGRNCLPNRHLSEVGLDLETGRVTIQKDRPDMLFIGVWPPRGGIGTRDRAWLRQRRRGDFPGRRS